MRAIRLCNGQRNASDTSSNVAIRQRKCSEADNNVEGSQSESETMSFINLFDER